MKACFSPELRRLARDYLKTYLVEIWLSTKQTKLLTGLLIVDDCSTRIPHSQRFRSVREPGVKSGARCGPKAFSVLPAFEGGLYIRVVASVLLEEGGANKAWRNLRRMIPALLFTMPKLSPNIEAMQSKAIVREGQELWLKKCEECRKEHYLGVERIFCDGCRRKKR